MAVFTVDAFVQLSMMPEGVEHLYGQPITLFADLVQLSMMPEGVEHTPYAAAPTGSGGAALNDAGRR